MTTTPEQELLDRQVAAARAAREGGMDGTGIVGHGTATLYGPDGEVKQEVPFGNLITDVGDLYYSQRAASLTPQAPTGMRLGTGTTAPSKSGAGAAIVTYVTGSNRPLDSGFPNAATKGAGAGARTTWQSTWAAGIATVNGLSEVVLTVESPLSNVAGTAANTLARALLIPTVNKGENDTLVVTWYHDFLGA